MTISNGAEDEGCVLELIERLKFRFLLPDESVIAS